MAVAVKMTVAPGLTFWPVGCEANVGGGVNWQSKTGQDLHTFTQGSYAVTNLMARYDITQNLSASLNLNNVFDKTYYVLDQYDNTYYGKSSYFGLSPNATYVLTYSLPLKKLSPRSS